VTYKITFTFTSLVKLAVECRTICL